MIRKSSVCWIQFMNKLVLLANCSGKPNKDTQGGELVPIPEDKTVVPILEDKTGFHHDNSFKKNQEVPDLISDCKKFLTVNNSIALFNTLINIADNVEFSRTCVIDLKNLGNRKLVNPKWYLSHGEIYQVIPHHLPVDEETRITFGKRSFAMAGTSGVLTYTISGTNHQVAVYWSVPFFFGIYSNKFNVQVGKNIEANEALFKSMEADEKKQIIWNSGSWVPYSRYGIKVEAAMTNSAEAHLQVRVACNITDPETEIVD